MGPEDVLGHLWQCLLYGEAQFTRQLVQVDLGIVNVKFPVSLKRLPTLCATYHPLFRRLEHFYTISNVMDKTM